MALCPLHLVTDLTLWSVLKCYGFVYYQWNVSSARVTIWSPAFLKNRLPSADIPFHALESSIHWSLCTIDQEEEEEELVCCILESFLKMAKFWVFLVVCTLDTSTCYWLHFAGLFFLYNTSIYYILKVAHKKGHSLVTRPLYIVSPCLLFVLLQLQM